MTYKIILASGSPRRKEILEQAGVTFQIIPSQKEEITSATEPQEVVAELASIKAEDVAKQAPANTIVIGADTIVCNEGTILGKPKDEAEAIEMLSKLQGHTHMVYTGVCLLIKNADGSVDVKKFVEATKVKISEITEEEIKKYCMTGEPLDKAGAYAIQGKFAKYVEGIEGDYYNVVGFPLARFYQEIKKLGLEI